MKPIGKRVLVRFVKKQGFYDSEELIAVPDTFRDTTNEGIVIALGSEVPCLLVGDRVLFKKRSGQVVKVADQLLKLMNFEDIVATVDVGRAQLCPACHGQGTVIQAIEEKE